MVLTEAQKYQKVNDWLLKKVNPELEEIQKVLNGITVNSCFEQPFSVFNQTPTNLGEVLFQVLRVEDCIGEICKIRISTFTPAELVLEMLPLPDLDKVLTTFLPKIDNSLSNIETCITMMNEGDCAIELTPAPANYSQQTELQKQARFIDKAKRIKKDLVLLQDILAVPKEVAPAVQFIYEAPEWSVAPETRFFFEVRKGDLHLASVDISQSGHYLLGRLPICDIVISDETCSRQHAVIQYRPTDPDEEGDEEDVPTDEIYIYDLGSTSGSYVNGMPLQEKAYYPLYPGDVLQFGQLNTVFILRHGVPTPSSGQVDEGTSMDQEESKKEKQINESEENIAPDQMFNECSTEGKSEAVTEQQDSIKDEKPLSKIPQDVPVSKRKVKPIVQVVRPQKLKPVVSLDPKADGFDKEAYKNQMIEAYKRQQEENLELLRKQEEREKQGLPPILYIPYVPERTKKRKFWFGKKGA